MHAIVLLAAGLLQAGVPDLFSLQADLQGRYDEISQASLQFQTEADIDDFHDVMYTADWSVTDSAGHRHEWADLRAQAIQALTAPPPTAMVQSIRKVALGPAGAIVTVNLTTVRTVMDVEGRYGRKGATHSLNETIPYRDMWVMAPGGWKLKAREQIGPPKVLVDKPDYEP